MSKLLFVPVAAILTSGCVLYYASDDDDAPRVDAGLPGPDTGPGMEVRVTFDLPCLRTLAAGDLWLDGPDEIFISYSCTGGAITADVVYDAGARTLVNANDRGDSSERFTRMVTVDVDKQPPADIVALVQDEIPDLWIFQRAGYSVGGAMSVDTIMSIDDILSADLDGDGGAELVVAGSGSLWRVTVGPSFGDITEAELLTDQDFQRVVVADLGGSGAPDLAYFAGPAPGKTTQTFGVAVQVATDPATFEAQTVFEEPAGPVASLLAADVDGDGKADVVGSSQDLFVLGSRHGVVARLSDPARQIAIGDVDGDGAADVLFVPSNGASVRRLRVFDDGQATTLVSEPFVDAGGDLLALADIDGDGLDDVILVSSLASPDSQLIVFPSSAR